MSEHQMAQVAINGQTLQKMSTSYATAVSVQKPRILEDVRRRLNDEARIGGEGFYYGWGVGKGKRVEGPSIQLATAAARSWGNCAVEMEDVQDLGDSWVFTAIFVDIETGFTLKRQFRQSKTFIIYGDHDDHRKDEMRFQIGQSKATRNVVVNALPKSLIREAMSTAKTGVRKRLEEWIAKKGEGGLVMAQDGALEQLKRLGVSEEQVLAKVSRPTRGAITVDDLVILKGDIMAIDDGNDRVEGLYPEVGQAEPTTEDLMDHLGGEVETGPEAAPAPDAKPPTGNSKPDATGGKETEIENNTFEDGPGGIAITAETTPPEAQDAQKAEITAEEVEEIMGGSYGPVSAESVTEFRARFARLDEDPKAIDKYSVDYTTMAELDGKLAVEAVRRIEKWYKASAVEYLAGKKS